MVTIIDAKNSALIKPFIIGLIVLTLQIPMSYITQLIQERDLSRRQASEQVAQMAGGPQHITTPVLTVGYSLPGPDPSVRIINKITVLPHSLKVNGKLTTSIRSRGIFGIPVYTGPVTIEGQFSLAEISEEITGTGAVFEKHGYISIGMRDLRGILNTPQVEWNRALFDFSPGAHVEGVMDKGIHTEVPLMAEDSKFHFSLKLELSGSQGFHLRPLAKSAQVTLDSNWGDPSFSGALMPSERSVGEAGFTASWFVSNLSLGIPTVWAKLSPSFAGSLDRAMAGVDLLSPIDAHRMTERATKYKILFFFLIFLAFFVYEVMAEVKLHPVQYLLVGGALTIFYLLLLSLSEHFGFTPAYCTATMVSTGLVSGYARAILRRAGKTWIIPPLMAGMYGFLYTLLVEEDFALLSGSLGLAAILGVLMYITRNVDWFALGSSTSPGQNSGTVEPTGN